MTPRRLREAADYLEGRDSPARSMRRTQRGMCPIRCDRPAEHVDHCHRTGAVRGMLCGGCNTGMGQLGDDPVALLRAADYLLGRLVRVVPGGDGEPPGPWWFRVCPEGSPWADCGRDHAACGGRPLNSRV
jgi:hypothetical protein